jgi:ornithine decarboxylase
MPTVRIPRQAVAHDRTRELALVEVAAQTATVDPLGPTPYLALDTEVAVAHARALSEALPGTGLRYAVKANPNPLLLAALAAAGYGFDVASPTEVSLALEAGARVQDLVYSNPVKRREDIAWAHARGVSLFVVDSPSEVRKVAEAAPGTSVLCRLVTSGAGSDWPLSRKYGCSTSEAVEILRTAAALGLDVAGTAFHVGSQQRDPSAWRAPLDASARVFRALRADGLNPWLVDLGGGFPADHDGGHPELDGYGSAIRFALHEAFGADVPATIIEPGRGVVGDAGVLVTSVIGVVHRAGTRWVFLDAGVFTGLVETLEEAIRYRITTSVGGPTGPAVLAGPTCDSADVLYQDVPVDLPLSLAEGDTVRLHSTGAYTSSYSTVGFNGFAPLPTHVVG